MFQMNCKYYVISFLLEHFQPVKAWQTAVHQSSNNRGAKQPPAGTQLVFEFDGGAVGDDFGGALHDGGGSKTDVDDCVRP